MTRLDVKLVRHQARHVLHTPFSIVALTRGDGLASDREAAMELAWEIEALEDRPSTRAGIDGALRLIGAGAGRDFALARRRLVQALREGRLVAHAVDAFRGVAVEQHMARVEPLGPDTTTWIEIVLRDQDAVPVSNARYQVVCDEAVIADGTLDDSGFARVEGLKQMGDYHVVFPEIDAAAWKAA